MFRLNRKVGQIYINRPGKSRFLVETSAATPHSLDKALEAAAKAFWDALDADEQFSKIEETEEK